MQPFSAQNIQILLHVPVDGGVGCRMASCSQSSSELSGLLTFSPKFLAMTILAVLERVDRRSPPDLLFMDSTFFVLTLPVLNGSDWDVQCLIQLLLS